jgi:tRNA-specific 2-thiouridylase
MMSGGVDSSVSAALLQEQGYEVIGLTLEQYKLDASKLKETQTDQCTDMQDAKKVADTLGFEHHSKNTTDYFHETVILPFVDSYRKGLTPNPCTHCNRNVKFVEAKNFADEFGCEYFATGHYAQLIKEGDNQWGLYRAVYKEKDQSYFLYGIRKELIPRIIFPLGGKNKEDVRAYAKKIGLTRVAGKPGSQDICFTKDLDNYTDFLERYIAPTPGPILDHQGNRLGTHDGIIHYTIGQRRGLGLSGGPFYVCRIDAENNAVIVGGKQDLAKKTVRADLPTWISEPQVGDTVMGQIRSRHLPAAATITEKNDTYFTLEFHEDQYGIAPGQALVLSQEDKILGGGVIAPTTP